MHGTTNERKREKMARFNLDEYETVESRIKRFYEQYPDGRIVTEWENNRTFDWDTEKPQPKTWVIKSYVYLTAGDQANNLPKATGYATETEGTGGANSAGAALENCETSSIGRALANMAMSGNKRASREEMTKVAKNSAPQVTMSYLDFIAKLDELDTAEEIRQLYADAKRAGAPKEVLDKIAEKGKAAK